MIQTSGHWFSEAIMLNRKGTVRSLSVLAALVLSTAAMAQEPKGCDAFKWPIARERALLMAASDKISSGNELPQLPLAASRIDLQAYEKVAFPLPTERAPRDKASFAGFIKIASIGKPGLYTVNLSANAWIDAIQNGAYLKTVAFSGATDCEGLRKSVKFDLGDTPLILQVSGVASDSIAVVIAPVSQ